MLTKEMENILKAFPSFMSMLSMARNPFVENRSNEDTMETVTKAIWFVLPFHFMSFLGMVPLAGGDTTLVLLIGFISLLGLSWVGTILGSLMGAVNGWGPIRRENCVASWVSALFVTWFFCVLIMSGLNGYFWWKYEDFAIWPELFNRMDKLLLNTLLYDFRVEVISIGIPLIAAGAMLLTIPHGRRGTPGQALILALVCMVSCTAFILASKELLEPMTRVAGVGPVGAVAALAPINP
ncbi:hypothetical protein QEZ52_10140 [Aliisedimentitalea scapharcae]|uniref:Yip1 domain-containing protein n=1 Tax=Aliisedimentitalea scapharcae TaxID=1524259 RepID=A0ABZ2Y1B8_9RHOB|nr:hypothetical protein K3727_10245 [Rhodobacteraceae bacterium M382]